MKILIVDDEKNILKTLTVSLTQAGHEVRSADSLAEADKALKTYKLDLVLTDFKLGQGSGLEVIKLVKKSDQPPVVVLMTAFASFDNAVNAIKEGAYDYLPKPFSNQQLEVLITKIQTLVDLKNENAELRAAQYRSDFFVGLLSPAMCRLDEFVKKVAPTDASVLLVGESGTGKSELARLIHGRSLRSVKPFVIVNCTTLAENLLESELFGHVKGAFTGATQDHIGKLEFAQRGTVLIDEVGELSAHGQTKLLRFLQERVIERVGSNKSIPLDVRVIAATNRNLEEAVKGGSFREDLYFRLNVFECDLVPIRFRREDLPVLIKRFWLESLAHAKLIEKKELPAGVNDILLKYSWPGNVRELKNVLERLVLLSQGREVEAGDLPNTVLSGNLIKSQEAIPGQMKKLDEIEREHIERVLLLEFSQERAAEILGITTVTLWRKRKQFGLP